MIKEALLRIELQFKKRKVEKMKRKQLELIKQLEQLKEQEKAK